MIKKILNIKGLLRSFKFVRIGFLGILNQAEKIKRVPSRYPRLVRSDRLYSGILDYYVGIIRVEFAQPLTRVFCFSLVKGVH